MKHLKPILIGVVGVIAIVLACVFFVQGVQNKAYSLEESVQTAAADIEVQEKRRIDLIPNLVDCVKEYDEHEYETLKDVVTARGANSDAAVQAVQTKVTALAEAYPELKSNENYKDLMNELSTTENMIAEYRSSYNKQIKEYNRYIRKFPNRTFLDMLGYEAIDFTYLEYNAPADAPTNLFDED